MKFNLVLGAAALCLATSVGAHHSATAIFDSTKTVEMSGKVTRVALRNPHVRVYFSVTDKDGVESEWMAEGGTWSILARRGWAGRDIHPGDTITIQGHPSRNGQNAMEMLTVILPDGRKLWCEDVPPNLNEQLEEMRSKRRTQNRLGEEPLPRGSTP